MALQLTHGVASYNIKLQCYLLSAIEGGCSACTAYNGLCMQHVTHDRHIAPLCKQLAGLVAISNIY